MDGPVEIDTNRAVAIIHTLPRYQTETIYVPLSRRGALPLISTDIIASSSIMMSTVLRNSTRGCLSPKAPNYKAAVASGRDFFSEMRCGEVYRPIRQEHIHV